MTCEMKQDEESIWRKYKLSQGITNTYDTDPYSAQEVKQCGYFRSRIQVQKGSGHMLVKSAMYINLAKNQGSCKAKTRDLKLSIQQACTQNKQCSKDKAPQASHIGNQQTIKILFFPKPNSVEYEVQLNQAISGRSLSESSVGALISKLLHHIKRCQCRRWHVRAIVGHVSTRC
ncbi:hypothetical protein CCACVL1_04259 [Corchorus capsularis]|uniref:Uncharacterized protein n=1 Tax=Corchorus capsularis TaxID=210143 RepID=A0A1R3JU38_COCAP|nr:hypothetical protein CCACVL1_04259 [Corchorus capsularis]